MWSCLWLVLLRGPVPALRSAGAQGRPRWAYRRLLPTGALAAPGHRSGTAATTGAAGAASGSPPSRHARAQCSRAVATCCGHEHAASTRTPAIGLNKPSGLSR